jgi:hypothetical protein
MKGYVDMDRNAYRYMILAAILLVLLALSSWWASERVGDFLYDLRHPNPPVTSKTEVDRILSEYRTVTPDQLPADYLRHSGMAGISGQSPERFYIVERRDLHRRIVGRNRLRQMVCRDLRYRSSLLTPGRTLYLGIDPEILHKAIELQQSLKANGFNPDALHINSGHRTPAHNRSVGGASGSRHQHGDALDLGIGDVDRNGRTDAHDKKIVLHFLDQRIIGSRGGLGLYPGTQTVHMDLRGYRARWNNR